MRRYHFKAENKTADSFQLVYATGNGNEAILYSFLQSDSTLYSVIDTERISNSRLIIDYLKQHYILVSANDEASLQYCFTTEDKSMVITTIKVTDLYFNVNYSFVYWNRMKNVTIRFSRFGGDVLVYSCIHVDVNTAIHVLMYSCVREYTNSPVVCCQRHQNKPCLGENR